MLDRLQLIIVVVLAGLVFGAGWTVNDWRRDALIKVESDAIVAEAKRYEAREADVASAVEARLATLKVQERVIDRTVIKEILKNDEVYARDCLTDIGRLQINNLAAGGPEASNPVAAMPSPTPPTGR